ncbi:4Fe-4S binding protein [Candidatus Altiarchaeota archaeon]
MRVNRNKCLYCGGCVGVCPQQAMVLKETIIAIDPVKCTQCGICEKFCPAGAISKGDPK